MKAGKLCLILIFFVLLAILLIISDLFFRPKQKKMHSGKTAGINIFKQTDYALTNPVIKVINIYGPIYFTEETNLFGIKSGADNIIDEINSAINEKNVVGLLLRINSPGGTVAASQEIYNTILKFKEKTGKPVVVSIADLAASGAYYISAGADTIFANQSSILGNIGVIMTGFTVHKLMEKIGVSPNVYISKEHKDIGSPFREPTASEKKIFQGTIDELYIQFVEAVKKGRTGKINDADKTIFDGRTFTGVTSLKNGLIDMDGGYYDALEYLWTITGNSGIPQTFDTKASNIWTKFFKVSSAFTQKNNLIKLLDQTGSQKEAPIKFLYQLVSEEIF